MKKMSSIILTKCDFDMILTTCYSTKMDIYQTLAENIVYFRKKANMDQMALGIALGFDPETAQSRISQWETGKRSPTKKNIERIANILGTTYSDLSSSMPPLRKESLCSQIYAVICRYGDFLKVQDSPLRSPSLDPMINHANGQINDITNNNIYPSNSSIL